MQKIILVLITEAGFFAQFEQVFDQKLITIKGEVWKTPATSAPENKGLDNLKNQ